MEGASIFPLGKVERGCILSAAGDITLAYQATLPEIFTLSERDYQAYHQAWLRSIRQLPEGVVLHKQDWFMETSYQASFDKTDVTFLNGSSERHFHERSYLDHQCYLFLTKKRSRSKKTNSSTSGILRKSVLSRASPDERSIESFEAQGHQFARVLMDSGFVALKRLGDDDLAGTANRPGIIERYAFLLGRQEPSTLLDINLRGGIRVGDKDCQLYTLSQTDDLPALCGSRVNYDAYGTDRSRFSVGMASPLGLLLQANHIFNQYLFIQDVPHTLKQLEAKRLRLQSLSGYSRENAVARDAVNDFLNEAATQQRMPVRAHFNVLCWSQTGEEKKQMRNNVSSAMSQMDAVAQLETAGAPQIWWAGLPGTAGDFPINDTFLTFPEQAACFFNLESNYRDSISPFGLRLGERLSGKPMHVDISDEPIRLGYTTNRNKFILGPSGSGKSFFTNHMVRAYYEQGAHVVLVDVGHSYRGLCSLLNGFYFTYSEDDPIRFNPFYLPADDKLDTEKKESIKTLLLALWKKDDEPFRRSEYVALSAALTLYFQHLERNPDIFPCFDSFYEFLQSDYVAVLAQGKVKERDFDVENFLYVLSPYYRGGEFDYLLNARDNLDLLTQPFIVFELDNIKDHPILFPVVTLILMELFISKMRKLKGVRKLLLIEECWKAISKDGMAEYIKYLFKTVRKYFGEAVVVTQEVEDIIASPVVKQAIINNSDCKILLDQSKYQNKFDGIQQLLGLTEKEKALVLSMNRANDPVRKYKEVFISLGGQCIKVYRTEVSLREYLCYTTEEREKMMVQEYTEKYGDVRTGIEMLARELIADRRTPKGEA